MLQGLIGGAVTGGSDGQPNPLLNMANMFSQAMQEDGHDQNGTQILQAAQTAAGSLGNLLQNAISQGTGRVVQIPAGGIRVQTVNNNRNSGNTASAGTPDNAVPLVNNILGQVSNLLQSATTGGSPSEDTADFTRMIGALQTGLQSGNLNQSMADILRSANTDDETGEVQENETSIFSEIIEKIIGKFTLQDFLQISQVMQQRGRGNSNESPWRPFLGPKMGASRKEFEDMLKEREILQLELPNVEICKMLDEKQYGGSVEDGESGVDEDVRIIMNSALDEIVKEMEDDLKDLL